MNHDPLSTFQADYWERDRARPGAPAIVYRAFDLEGPVDLSDLRRRMAETVRRHDSLRTRFTVVDGAPRQVVSPEVPVEIEEIDLRGLPQDERDGRARSHERTERDRPFDLASAPLWRVALLRLTERESVLSFAVHHIVCDGWSASLLAAELFGAPAERPVSRYAEFVAWERAETSGRLPAAVAYWKPRMEPPPAPLALPAVAPRAAVRGYRGERLAFTWPASLADGLRHAARAKRASPFMVLLTAFTAAVHSVTGDRDIAVASLFAGRDRAEFETMIGLLARTTVFRVDLSGDPTGDELLSRVRGVVLDTHDHASVPLRAVAREIFGEPAGRQVLSRMWDVWFNLLPTPAAPDDLPTARVRPRPPDPGAAVSKDERDWEGENLTLTVTGLAPEPRGHLDFNALLIAPETAERLLSAFQGALRRLLDDSAAPLSALATSGGG